LVRCQRQGCEDGMQLSTGENEKSACKSEIATGDHETSIQLTKCAKY